MMKKILRVGSRDSVLATAQSQIVIDIIRKNFPQYDVRLAAIKTSGDKILDKTLDKIGGKGLFVRELDTALLNNIVDITVHSLKDIPADIDSRIPIAAYTKCQSPYDTLVLPNNISSIDFSKPIGTSGARRAVQLGRIYPQAHFKPVRGNVLTRLEKLDRGEYSALVLAAAGLQRLGLSHRISRVFTADEVIPAAGQGVIAVQTRAGEYGDIAAAVNDERQAALSRAERAFISALGGSCTDPAAAYARFDGDKIDIIGMYAIDDKICIKQISGAANDGITLAGRLARIVKEGLR